jgi:predicted nucleic acid-binding protein
MRATVLDSWAIIAWLQGEEPARSTVREILEQAATSGGGDVSVSMINIGEVFYLMAKRRGAAVAERFLAEIPTMPIQSLVPDRKLIVDAARLKSKFPVSYADAFAVETARRQKATLVTGDPELLALSKREPIELMWIGG